MWLFIKRIILVKHNGYGIKSCPLLKWRMNAASWWLWNLIRASYHECARWGEVRRRPRKRISSVSWNLSFIARHSQRTALPEDDVIQRWQHWELPVKILYLYGWVPVWLTVSFRGIQSMSSVSTHCVFTFAHFYWRDPIKILKRTHLLSRLSNDEKRHPKMLIIYIVR